MLENALSARNLSVRLKVTVMSLVSAGLIVLAVALPQLVHLVAGASGGIRWLPMYLPVLLAGCLLGVRMGLMVGVASPLVSFLITSLLGNAMPAAVRLPYMIAELAVYAAVSGLFTRSIAGSRLAAFPAVLLASVAGRSLFMLASVAFMAVSPLTPSVVWAQIQEGFIGLIAQAVLAPVIIMAVGKLLEKK